MPSVPPPSSDNPPELWPRITAPPRLLASTGDTYRCSVSSTAAREELQVPEADNNTADRRNRKFLNGSESNVFKSAQWTSDGTTLLAHNEDEGLRTFILPPDLLSPSSDDPKHLQPYSIVFSPSRVYSTALYPQATLSDPQTFLFLSSPRDAPIRLHSLLFPALISSYPLVNPNNEKYEAPYSLLIPPSNPHTFLAGTKSQISIFDVNRNGDGPVVVLKTIPTRKSPMTTETMKGLVTALSLAPGSAGTGAGVLAAGTYTRQVGLYADDGRGDVIGVFALPENDEKGGGGGGVTQLLWSQDGRYLYIAERLSDVVSVYDIRVTGMRVESFAGRNAATNQRMAVDVAYGLGGEVLGGGLDGSVKIWESGHGKGGAAVGSAVGGWQAHDDPVTSAVMHPSGSVMATCSGQRKAFGLRSASSGGSSDSDGDDSEGESVAWDNSLKIWDIPAARNSLEVG